MNAAVQEIEVPSLYEYLRAVREADHPYMHAAALLAEYRPIYPDDPEWCGAIDQNYDKVASFFDRGLKVIGIVQDGECVAFCGYRMVARPLIIICGQEVDLPYEMFLAVDDGMEISPNLIYSAQMFVASCEDLKIVEMAPY
ncbi:MAG: hypothetical protein SA339_04110 [Methanomassiliicoccus sp.]|nr:hypothetical protein [Methanomassiliicoccus sp.]